MPDEEIPEQLPSNVNGDSMSTDPMSKKTKEAAAHASQQLDELMASLQQLKVSKPFYSFLSNRFYYSSCIQFMEWLDEKRVVHFSILVSAATTSL